MESEINYSKETIFATLEKAIEDATTKVMKEGTRKDIKALLSAQDSEVYNKLICTLAGLKMRQLLNGKRKEAIVTGEIKEDIKGMIVELETNPTIWAKVKAFIAFIVRKTAALLKGTFAFVFDATTILGLMVGRVVYNTSREMVFASQAICTAFKKDIIDTVKKA
ncbi:hypothetical protein [Clostridium estertheticum]|uniref:hypothetical protein n=1 Tax=Clostridium estertheticum TaxID=238834 RepID=UPI001C7CA619|nr:hypothetical protein [Clostridium estertheticum]MBX4271979.1 hypothetical protein [Clostridium estertheticum]WLC80752.1 hypothetical protein KTC98_05570 [Clostridium estertheticum]